MDLSPQICLRNPLCVYVCLRLLFTIGMSAMRLRVRARVRMCLCACVHVYMFVSPHLDSSATPSAEDEDPALED